MKVFISYSHEDKNAAEKIATDLGTQGIDVWLDDDIKNSAVWLKQIDRAMVEADFVLGLITNDYLKSTGATEGFTVIGKHIKDEVSKFIPLFFENPGNIDSYIIAGMQGFLFYEDYDRELRKLVSELKTQQGETAGEILSKVESPDHGNPFYRVRTELFEDDYSLIAQAFAEPESTLYETCTSSAEMRQICL